jgi:hypothetical protein
MHLIERGTAGSMRRRSFSPAKAALVVILVGTIYMVSLKVNPAPPGPPPEHVVPVQTEQQKAHVEALTNHQTKPPGSMTQEQMALKMKQEMWQSELAHKKAEIAKNLNGGKELPKNEDISPAYFGDHKMGKDGLAQVDKEAADKKRIDAEVAKRVANIKPPPGLGAKPSPSDQPTSVPPPAATAPK